MNIEQLRKYSLLFPGATEDVKWGNDLCFCVGGKMFCVTGVESQADGISFKCTPEVFAELVEHHGIMPARYVARYHWVTVTDLKAVSARELKTLIATSYQLVFDKLPSKVKSSRAG